MILSLIPFSLLPQHPICDQAFLMAQAFSLTTAPNLTPLSTPCLGWSFLLQLPGDPLHTLLILPFGIHSLQKQPD